jgi:hypothetical protein
MIMLFRCNLYCERLYALALFPVRNPVLVEIRLEQRCPKAGFLLI